MLGLFFQPFLKPYVNITLKKAPKLHRAPLVLWLIAFEKMEMLIFLPFRDYSETLRNKGCFQREN